jgi:hypothetical protein
VGVGIKRSGWREGVVDAQVSSGIDPEAVFDDLNTGGHIKVWDSEVDALGHFAVQAAERHLDGVSQAVAVDTNDTAAAVNEVVRDHLVSAGARRRHPDHARPPTGCASASATTS